MSTVNIPQWNAHGVLPPINLASPTSLDRSPYNVTLTDLIHRYATSRQRKNILNGFLNFRHELHNLGLVQGFQWLDGSFLENIELIEERSPNDIDIVTFYCLPSNVTQITLLDSNPRLFNSKHTKKDFLVDAYFVQLNTNNNKALIRNAIYWNTFGRIGVMICGKAI